jgi:uncharacterized damage-inducible protein DinB
MKLPILVLVASSAFAQEGVTVNLKALLADYKKKIVAISTAFNPADQDFKPTPEVMSVKELVTHIGDANYSLCAQLKGEAKPKPVGTLAESFDYCLAAVDAIDGKMAQKTSAKTPRDKGWIAFHLLEHNALHYGNLVTYLRIKGMAPPKG